MKVTAGLVAVMGWISVRASELVVRGEEGALTPCTSLAWTPHDRIPVFDALTPPDTPEGLLKLQALDQVVRTTVEESLRKRKRPMVAGDAPCRVSYTVFLEIELDIARHGGGTMAPRTSDPVGGGSMDSAQQSRLKQAATFTLRIRPAEGDLVLWQGELKGPVGTASQIPKRLGRIVRKVSEAVPRG